MHWKEKILSNTEKKNINNNQNFEIRICMDFDQNFLDLESFFKSNFKTLKKTFNWLDNFEINFTNSIFPV